MFIFKSIDDYVLLDYIGLVVVIIFLGAVFAVVAGSVLNIMLYTLTGR